MTGDWDLPHSDEAEMSVLGACMLSDDAYWQVADLRAAEFYRPRHRRIWRAIDAVARRFDGNGLNWVTVHAELAVAGEAEDAGGAYLTELVTVTPTALHVGHFAGIVREMARRRRVIGAATRLVAAAHAGEDQAPILTELYDAAAGATTEAEAPSIRDLLDRYAGTLDTLEADPRQLSGLTTGIPRLDKLTRGLQAGELTIIGATTSTGKSQFTLVMANHIARRHGPVLFFSLEMSEYSLLERLLAAAAGVDLVEVIGGGIWTPDELRRWQAARRAYLADDVPLFIDETSAIETATIRARLTRFLTRRPETKLIVVDYLDLVGDAGDNEPIRRGEIAKAIRGIAQSFKIHAVLLSQLNRATEHQPNKRPTTANLKWSAQIGEVADNVILLHRPTPDENKLPNTLTILIDKQRRGPRTDFDVEFIRETGRIGERTLRAVGE